MKHLAGFLLFACLALSGCGLTGLPRADQAGRIANQQLEARDAELDKLAERNSQLRKETDEAVMDVPAKAGSGVVGEIDLSKAFTGKDRRQIASKGKADAVKLEFTDASLKDIIIVFMQDYLKQPYTFQPSFKDTQVNLFFDAKATREDLIKLFDTLLENYGVRLRYSGGVYLIGSVEDKTSVIQQPSPLGIGDAVGVFRANYLDAREFLALAKQVVKYPEKLSVITGNVIIVNSTSIDVRAVHALLQDIDQPSFSGKHILVYSPRYLSAASMIALLDNTQNQLLGTQNIGRQFDAKQIQDTDRIIIVAANQSASDLLLQLLAQADVIGGNRRRVFQYSLATQNAADVVPNLTNMIRSVIKSAVEISVLADRTSNSLLIYASPEEYAEIRKLLARLDFRPPAVEVDMVIAEVNLNQGMRYGVEWYLKRKINSIGLFRQDTTDVITNLGVPAATTPNLAFTLAGLSNYATLQLLGSETTFSLLSNPKIMVKNGATAKIYVGREEPVIKQKTTNTGAANSTVVEPDFKKIGLELEVQPFITSNNEVRMIIKLKDTDITGSKTLGTDVYPVLSSRELTTDLVAGDGKTIFLGGIRKQTTTDASQKIPGLGDLQGVGALFRNKDIADFGTELIILATPTIMLDQQGADVVTQAILRAAKREFSALRASEPEASKSSKPDTGTQNQPETPAPAADQHAQARPGKGIQNKNGSEATNTLGLPSARAQTAPNAPAQTAEDSLRNGKTSAGAVNSASPDSMPVLNAPLADGGVHNSITALGVSSAGKGKTVIKVELSQPLADLPPGFAINTPPRIMYDFPDTSNGLGKTMQNFSKGNLRSANIVQAGNRTRLVVNLKQMLIYDTRIDGNSVLITLQDKAADNIPAGVEPRVAETKTGVPEAKPGKKDDRSLLRQLDTPASFSDPGTAAVPASAIMVP